MQTPITDDKLIFMVSQPRAGSTMLQSMLGDWVKATGDSDEDFYDPTIDPLGLTDPDFEGAQAGYLYCTMTYGAEEKKLRSKKPKIDDVDNPGLIDALREDFADLDHADGRYHVEC